VVGFVRHGGISARRFCLHASPGTRSMRLFSMRHNAAALLLAGLLAIPLGDRWLSAAPLPAATLSALEKAQAGATVAVPAGTFEAGDVAVPAGVTLKGAGRGLTILNAKGKKNGIVLGAGARLSDLTIENAGENGVAIVGGKDAAVSRVVVRGSQSGVLVQKATDTRVENCVLAENRTGLTLVEAEKCVAANLTLTNNLAIGMTISGCRGCRVFNNLVVGSQIGVSLVGSTDLALDHNVYVCNFTGSFGDVKGRPSRQKVGAWASLTGHDRHSLMLPVTLSKSYALTNTLDWSPALPVTALWAVKELAGAKAPADDIDGVPRGERQGVGAVAITAMKTPRPADGTFEIRSGAGVASAGLYTKAGDLVAYLFQNQPLPKGRFEFWLPSRTWTGQPIAAGDYELKVTEADLAFEYVAAAGNGDAVTSAAPMTKSGSRLGQDPQMVVFPSAGGLILVRSGFESHVHLQSFSTDLHTFRWAFEGGGTTKAAGAAIDDKGRLSVLRKTDGSVLRLDATTGQPADFAGGTLLKILDKPWSDPKQPGNGLAFWNGKLVTADPVANQLVLWNGETFERAGQIAVASPAWPSADAKTGLLWVIRDDKDVVALDAAGTIKATATPVPEPTLLAVANGRLAVWSKSARQISIFDCVNPNKLTLLHTVGTGGPSNGPILPERFWAPTSLAMGPGGELAVIDAPRLLVFDAAGKPMAQSLGMWGQQISAGQFANDDRMHFFNLGGRYSIAIDPKTRSWSPDVVWRYSMEGDPMYCFAAGGKTFCVATRTDKKPGLIVYEMTPATGVAKAVMRINGDGSIQKDADGDGLIADGDPATPPVPGVNLNGRFVRTSRFRPDGMLVNAAPMIVPMTGLGADGLPVFAFDKVRLPKPTVGGGKEFLSPYDFTTKESAHTREEAVLDSRGTLVAGTLLKGSAGADLCTEHGGETDILGLAPDGHVRWLNPLDPKGLKAGFFGLHNLLDVTFAGRGAECEFETMDADGLGTGVLGTPVAMGWGGMWLDNARQSYGFVGNDGKAHMVLGDYSAQAYHWLTVTGIERIQKHSVNVKVDMPLAAALAAAPAQPVREWPVSSVSPLVIPKLVAPLTMDGDPAKWRGIQPLLLTPELAGKAIGPENSSAVVRFAWEGTDLYVQVVKFDDKSVLFQKDPSKHYLQDGVEIAINSYPEGFKYNITVIDGKPAVFRDTWRADYGKPELNALLTPEVAPRSIKVIDDTTPVAAERAAIEAATGADLSKASAMVIEVRIPQSSMTPMERPKMEVEFASGKGFRLGIMLNDNDVPGWDALNPVVWPSTYYTFARPDVLAPAVFE
jgi:hypothetical protein